MSPDRATIERHVNKVLAGAEFARSGRMARFLRFIVQHTLDAREGELKERTIGVAVFDRSQDWDPKTDTIVRSEARRLRAKLETYYGSAGADDLLRVRVPKGGYVPEFELNPASADAAVPISVPDAEAPLPRPGRRWLWVAIVLVLTGICWLLWRTGEETRSAGDVFEIRPFATAFGRELQPAISPDGTQVAYVWDGDHTGFDIYVKTVKTGEVARITNSGSSNLHPAWSPDGRTLAFLRLTEAGAQVILHSLASGSERTLTQIQAHDGAWAGDSTPLLGNPGPVWTPDGLNLIVTDYEPANGNSGLFSVALADGARHAVVHSPQSIRDFLPRVSPDGRRLVFVRYWTHGSGDLFVSDLAGGPLARITFDARTISGLSWTPDGQNLVFASNRRGNYQLWEIARGGGISRHLPTDSSSVADLALSPGGDWMSIVSIVENWNIWRARITPTKLSNPERFLASSGRNHTPRFSPDGGKIAFVSDRSGSWELWMADADGLHLRQLTHFRGPWVGGVNWSPDSRQIAMDARPHGHSALFAITVASGKLQMLEENSFEQRMPAWSRDGQSLYFNSDRDGKVAIWKLRLADKSTRKVSPAGAFAAAESADGRTLFFTLDDGRLWSSQTDGVGAAPVTPAIRCSPSINWSVSGADVFFTRENDKSQAEFWRLTGQGPRLLSTNNRQLVAATPNLTVSPDGRWLLFAEKDNVASDINLRIGTLP